MSRPMLDGLLAAHGRRWLFDALSARWPEHRRPLNGAWRQSGPLDLARVVLRLPETQVLQCLLHDPDEAASLLLAEIDLVHAAGAEPQPDAVPACQCQRPEDSAAAALRSFFISWCHAQGLPVWSQGDPITTGDR